MKWTRLWGMVLVAIATMTLWVSVTVPVWAARVTPNQSNQDMNRPAQLIAPEPNSQINLYGQPNIRKQRVGYALGGDRAIILRQVGSNDGTTWSYIRVDKDPKTEGWVQDNFISMQNSPSQTNAANNPWSQLVQSIQAFGNPQTQPSQNSGYQNQSQSFNQRGGSNQQTQSYSE